VPVDAERPPPVELGQHRRLLGLVTAAPFLEGDEPIEQRCDIPPSDLGDHVGEHGSIVTEGCDTASTSFRTRRVARSGPAPGRLDGDVR
jgi:hypothetical protein